MIRTFAAATALAALLLAGAEPAQADVSCFPGCYYSKPVAEKQTRSARSASATTSRSRSNRTSSDSSSSSSTRTASRTPTRAYGGSVAGSSTGVASFYWQPQRVASGGWFNPNAMTAAHKTLPFGTRVRVTHLGNGRKVDVTINDRGPYIGGRIIDLSKAAAGVIGMQGQGIAQVRMDVIGR